MAAAAAAQQQQQDPYRQEYLQYQQYMQRYQQLQQHQQQRAQQAGFAYGMAAAAGAAQQHDPARGAGNQVAAAAQGYSRAYRSGSGDGYGGDGGYPNM